MPFFTSHRFLPVIWLLLVLGFWPLAAVQAQVIPEELLLNKYQPEGKASKKITIKSGFNIPEGTQFVGAIITNLPPTPPAIVQTTGCGYVLLQAQTPATEGVSYYFLRSLADTDLNLSHLNTLKVAEAGTYYLRSYNTAGFWSSNYTSITIAAESIPIPAAHPAQAYVFYLSDGSAELRTRQTAPGQMSYYWQATANGTATDKPAITTTGSFYRATSSGTYYLRTKVTATDCWSEEVSEVKVQIANDLTLVDDLKILPDPGLNQNYVVENTLLEAMTSIPADGLYVSEISQQITYVDGLSRPVQTVQTQGIPAKKDIVQPVTYDPFGRQNKQYLPYPHVSGRDGHFQADAVTQQQQQLDVLKNNPGPAYTESRLEASPLNRVLEQGAPGTAWQLKPIANDGHTMKVLSRANRDNEVRKWTYVFDDPDTDADETGIDGSSFYTLACTGTPLYVKDNCWSSKRRMSMAIRVWSTKTRKGGSFVRKYRFREIRIRKPWRKKTC